jgi:hypothetical protein
MLFLKLKRAISLAGIKAPKGQRKINIDFDVVYNKSRKKTLLSY